MGQEHCEARDATSFYKVSNVSIKFRSGDAATMSLIEWFFVIDPSEPGLAKVNEKLPKEKRIVCWPMELNDMDSTQPKFEEAKEFVRVATPLNSFIEQLKTRKINKRLLDMRVRKVLEEEVIGVRLYTGPMYIK